jgi:hypothetical protein
LKSVRILCATLFGLLGLGAALQGAHLLYVDYLFASSSAIQTYAIVDDVGENWNHRFPVYFHYIAGTEPFKNQYNADEKARKGLLPGTYFPVKYLRTAPETVQVENLADNRHQFAIPLCMLLSGAVLVFCSAGVILSSKQKSKRRN